MAKNKHVVIGTAPYDGVAGLAPCRSTRHLGRPLVEARVADDRPAPLRPVVDLYKPLVVVRTADEPDLVSAPRVHVRVVDAVDGLDGNGRATAAVRPVLGRVDRAEADAVVRGAGDDQRAENEDADARVELELDAGLDRQRFVFHHRQIAAYHVRLVAAMQPQVLRQAAAERPVQVKDGRLSAAGRSRGAERVGR